MSIVFADTSYFIALLNPHDVANARAVALTADASVVIVPPSPEMFEKGLDYFARRHDKAWSLTDCISFLVTAEHGITDAWTADHHFEQAGFTALLK